MNFFITRPIFACVIALLMIIAGVLLALFGRLTLPAACGGLAKQCLAIARSWGRERVQWGRAIGRHEAGAVKIGEIAATAFAIEAVTWLTSHWADEGRDVRIEAAQRQRRVHQAPARLAGEELEIGRAHV